MIKVRKSHYQYSDMNPKVISVKNVNYIVECDDSQTQSLSTLEMLLIEGKVKQRKGQSVKSLINEWLNN